MMRTYVLGIVTGVSVSAIILSCVIVLNAETVGTCLSLVTR